MSRDGRSQHADRCRAPLRLALCAVFALMNVPRVAAAPGNHPGAQPDQSPRASAQGADSASPPGSELSVYLMTMGQGDQIWERFGHNAIGIRNSRTGTDIVYNWGIFSFEQQGFLARFLRGDMQYWMAPFDGGASVVEYVTLNRDVTIQELNLSPEQRLQLQEFVSWNSLEENKYYSYDYFRDNCSTRVRDALDRVLGGAILKATASVGTQMSYRDHALRLMAEDHLISLGVDIGLGRPADRPISAWEEMFIPMKLRDHIRELRVPDESGRLHPLVTAERQVFAATRERERPERPATLLPFAIFGLLTAALLWSVARYAVAGSLAARRIALGVVIVWGVVIGVVGILLIALRTLTSHEFAYDNTNQFLYNPLWLLLSLLIPFAGRESVARSRDLTARVAAVVTVLGLVGWFFPLFRQDSLAVMLLAAPVNLAAAGVVLSLSRVPPAPAE